MHLDPMGRGTRAFWLWKHAWHRIPPGFTEPLAPNTLELCRQLVKHADPIWGPLIDAASPAKSLLSLTDIPSRGWTTGPECFNARGTDVANRILQKHGAVGKKRGIGVQRHTAEDQAILF